jgi:hypothetical protein
VAAIFPEHFHSFTVALKNLLFFLIILCKIVSALSKIVNKNNQKLSGKDEITGSYESCDSLRASRRMDHARAHKP